MKNNKNLNNKKFTQKNFERLKKTTLNNKKFIINFLISFFLLLETLPFFSIVFLFNFSLYLWFVENDRDYKSFLKIWFPILSIWYLIFTITLSSITQPPIVVGGEHTIKLVLILLENDFFFEPLCFHTIILLHILSIKVNCCIYVPVLVFKKSFFTDYI